MTQLLEQAIARLQTLSESEQNAIASIILEEIEDERHILAKLAASAMAEYHAGETHPLNPETLNHDAQNQPRTCR